MISVIIATKDSERALVSTLGALVPGAAAGAVREVIVADAGSSDQTIDAADFAGCRILVSQTSLASRLRAAAKITRASWFLFLRPGVVPDATWIAECMRFVEDAERTRQMERQAAVFRPAPGPGALRPTLIEALALLRIALGGKPRPEQGLLIARKLYDRLGGYREDAADCEIDLLRRLGRRRIVMLRCGAVSVADS